MFKTINALRGIFAIVIVLFHSKIHLMDQAVSLGVCFFFVASGFLTTLHHRHEFDTLQAGHWWRFWWRRACRIYPLHWLALALLVGLQVWLEHRPVKWPELISVATLTQAWVNDKAYYFGYNGASWFLSALLFCYACFPLIGRWYCRLRLRWQVLLLTAILLLLVWWLPTVSGRLRTFTYVLPVMRLGDFLMGVTAANIYMAVKHHHDSYSTTKATLIEGAIMLVVLEVLLLNRYTGAITVWDQYLVWWIPATLIVFGAAMLHKQEGWLGRLLLLPPFQWLGKVSLEIYLFQTVAAILVNYTVSPLLGHFGIMAYDKYVYSQVPLLLLLAWGIQHCRQLIRRSHRQAAN